MLGRTSSTDHLFRPLLDKELEKIMSFYKEQERELLEKLDALEDQVLSKESQGLQPDGAYLHDDDDDDDEEEEEEYDDLLSPSTDYSSRRRRSASFSKSPAGRTYLLYAT